MKLVDRLRHWGTGAGYEAADRIEILEEALQRIVAIPNRTSGGDWEEIEAARAIAAEALERLI